MAIRNSYAGRLTSKLKTSTILLEIKKATVLTPPHGYNDHILLVTENMTDVPSFVHPLLDEQTGRVYIDARPYTLIDRDGSFRVRNEADYELNVIRAKMELIWATASRTEVSSALDFSNEVFVRWLSELICFKYKLNPSQQSDLVGICALYVVGQYLTEQPDERDVMRYVQAISSKYHIDSTRLFSMHDQVGMPADLDSFIDAVHKLNISPRLTDLNALTLAHAIGGSWFISVWAMDIVSLALEYPPAFASLVFMAMKYKMFKRSAIGERVDRMNRRSNWEDFSRGIQSLFDRYIKDGIATRRHGFESYDVPAYPAVGLEADWGKIAMGTGAAAALFFFIYKLYGWITGSGSGGGGSSSGSTGLPGAVAKVSERVDKSGERAEEMQSNAEEAKQKVEETIENSKREVTEDGVDAVVDKLPKDVAAAASHIVDNAPTPMQSAIAAYVISRHAANSDAADAWVKAILAVISAVISKHRMTDKQVIAALTGWDLYSARIGHSNISIITARYHTPDSSNEIPPTYVKDLEGYIDRLVKNPVWHSNPEVAAAFSYDTVVIEGIGAGGEKYLSPDLLLKTAGEVKSILGNITAMLIGVIGALGEHASAVIAGETSRVSKATLDAIPDHIQTLAEYYNHPNVAHALDTRNELWRLNNSIKVSTVVAGSGPADSSTTDFEKYPVDTICAQFKDMRSSFKKTLDEINGVSCDEQMGRANTASETLITLQSKGELPADTFKPKELSEIRELYIKYAVVWGVYGEMAKIINFNVRCCDAYVTVVNTFVRAQKAMAIQINHAIDACKEK